MAVYVQRGYEGLGAFDWNVFSTTVGTTLSNLWGKQGYQYPYPLPGQTAYPSTPINWGAYIPIAIIGAVIFMALRK